jgi:hypothetical protein
MNDRFWYSRFRFSRFSRFSFGFGRFSRFSFGFGRFRSIFRIRFKHRLREEGKIIFVPQY